MGRASGIAEGRERSPTKNKNSSFLKQLFIDQLRAVLGIWCERHALILYQVRQYHR